MRELWRVLCACAALSAGGAFASDELKPIDAVEVTPGTNLLTKLRTNFDIIDGCFLVPPNGETIQFMPEDLSNDKFQLEDPIPLYGCQVNIKNIDKNDIGIWELYYTTTDGVKLGSQYYDISLELQEAVTENIKSEDTILSDPSIQTLSTIHYGARIGISITITLSWQDYVEECYLQTPQGETISLEEVEIEGVHVYPTNSNFVSCRVVIGPMNELGTLLGTWTLCGRHTEGENKFERCQPGYIFWALTNPSDNWASTRETNFDHVVNFGFSLSTAARLGTGTINTCHVITPAGEDIVLSTDSDYPGLQRVHNIRNVNACNVTFGPIDANFIGDWTIYGTYNGNDRTGFNVVERPMHFFLYDEDNPYSQAYNITMLNEQSHIISVNGIIIVTVLGTVTRNGCEFITNTNKFYDENSLMNLPGVAFMNNDTACRLQIGPMTQDLFGEWKLIGKFFRRNIFSELQLPFKLIIEDPANPIPDTTERDIQYLNRQSFTSSYGESNLVTTARASNLVTQSCHIRTPDNLQYVLREGWAQPGIEGVVGAFSCAVRVHVNDESANGEWMLIARIAIRGVPIERRLIFDINVKDDEKESIEEENEGNPVPVILSPINYVARFGLSITITLSRQDYDEECYLQTPNGDVVKFEDMHLSNVHVYPTSTHFVSCRVVIGPMDETLIGTWSLCGKHIEGESIRERCQPGTITGPAENWAENNQANFNHVVNFGFSLSPVVRGTGTLSTCHVITPLGEDIALTAESDYPGLRRIIFVRDVTACGVTFGPINVHFLGNWALYGAYNSAVDRFNVATFPMTFFLYDEENPYNQAYNVTQLVTETHVLTEGLTEIVQVVGAGTRDTCEFVTNTGELYNMTTSADVPGATFVNNANTVCRLQLGPVTKDMFGEWRLIGKFNRNNLFNEFRLPFRLIEEDPVNPIPDDIDRSIEYLRTVDTYTSFGNTHTFSTATQNRMTTESCHIRTPDHLQYILRPGLVHPEFETVTQSSISCGVRVNVIDDSLGEWMLIARENVQGTRIERRLPFIIHVEEEVNAVPNIVTVAEGNDLHLRLENATSLFETCVLIGPLRNDAERDENNVDTCGFIVRDVTLADTGVWEIEYGSRVRYRAFINVTVTGRFDTNKISSFVWKNDEPLNVTIGPEDTSYCRVEDPYGLIVFEGFERCNIVLDQVRTEHTGVWKMTIGTPGRVRTDTHEFVVKISEAAPKAQVITSVVSEKPSVMLSCQVESEHIVTACKFRGPSGKVLLASQGVGEDRYSFHGVGVSLHSEVSHRVCGLRITNPVVEDLGLWRCVIETEKDTYYGFLSVLCPWAMQDPDVAAVVVSVPTLTSETDSIKAVEGNTVTMRCSIQSAIRYCYFRAQNGTVLNVSPGTADWYEYVGAGLDTGECGIRFPGLQADDSGRWSCHVGFNEHSEPEQLTQINVHVDAEMVADQFMVLLEDQPDTLVVRGQVHNHRTLEYCRFVRIDGRGFTSDNVPSGYGDHSLLANGKCEIRIPQPSILEQHPWTVVAKMVGYHSEVSRSTEHTLTMPEHQGDRDINVSVILWCVLAVSMVILILGLLLGPKKNRQWVYHRATSARNSLRRSLIKQPLPAADHEPTQTTLTAA